jgi:aminocarboxymuconate-semialdehyde decarboxylase
MAVVDAHAHVIVPEVLREVAPEEAWRPRVWRQEGRQAFEVGGREVRSAVREWTDLERILADQDAAGTDVVVLSPLVLLLGYDADPDEGLRRCRIQNGGLAHLVRAGGGRVAALGAVPLQDPALAADELRALMADGTRRGVEIAASVNGRFLGDDMFEPFWSAAEETGALVFIHPTTRGFDAPVFGEHYLWNTVGNPFETTIAAAHMTMAGVMERHPGLRVLLAHAGGALLALRGRLRHAHTFQPEARSRLEESPLASMRRFHFDTVTHDRALLRALIDWVGTERVLLGSDYPFDMAEPDPVGSVRSLGLDPDVERAVLADNATRLLPDAAGEAMRASEARA